MTSTVYFLKLRANVLLEGDVDLAEREVRAFFGSVQRAGPLKVERKFGFPPAVAASHVRAGDCTGFVAWESAKSASELVMLLNFIQEIWFERTADSGPVPQGPGVKAVRHDER